MASSLRSVCALPRSAGALCRRGLATTASPPAPIAASAAAATAAPVPTHAYAAAQGKTVSLSWSRFNLEDTRAIDVIEARKVAVTSNVADTPAVTARRAVIFKAGQSAMTSGTGASRHWGIRFNHVDKWGNPLMGWVSSADTMAPLTMHLRFESAEAAVLACERNGWTYEVQPPHEKVAGRADNQYAYNFLSREVQYKMKTLGARRSSAIFHNPEGGSSQWVNFRHTTYGPDAWKPAAYQTQTAWTGPEWPSRHAHDDKEHK